MGGGNGDDDIDDDGDDEVEEDVGMGRAGLMKISSFAEMSDGFRLNDGPRTNASSPLKVTLESVLATTLTKSSA